MDAKPVRGGFRIHDENIMPMAQHKTLHSRNKSSPALSTLAKNGAMKMPVKRTAFGDISQTTKGNRPLTEISLIGKDVKVHQDKKHLPSLSQPAQKPHSTLALQPLAEVNQNTQVKKAISKRATTIFQGYNVLSQYIPSNEPQTRKSDSLVSQPQSSTEVKVENKLIPSAEVIDPYPSTHSNLLAGIQDLHIPVSQVDHNAPAVKPSEVIPQVKQEKPLPTQPIDEVKHLVSNHQNAQINQYPAVQVADVTAYFTPEQYIDEEYNEDDGYATARSFRSKSENVTEGNITIHLAPKSNRDIEVELQAAAAVVAMLKEPADIDDEEWDISMVSEYKHEIFEYYRELETRMAPNPYYMDVQTEIQWSMRSVLVDWVVQVHDRFSLLPETLYLTINIIDRFLSIKVVSMNKLQLVGATALFVAAKYEEIQCPTLKEMVFMVDNGYDEDEILKAERFMLTLLGFDLGWPGPMSFLRRVSTADDYDLETRTVAKYFLEMTIMDEQFLASPPSFLAAGAHCLARLMLNKGHWSTAHVHYSGYTYAQLFPLLCTLVDCLENPINHHNAIYEKYCNKKFRGAASFARGEMQRGFRLIDAHTNLALNYDSLCHSEAIFEYLYRDVPGYGGHAGRIEQKFSFPRIC